MPDRLVISNTSPLLYLYQVGQLDLLQKLYGRVQIPAAVQEELLGLARSRALLSRSWMRWIGWRYSLSVMFACCR